MVEEINAENCGVNRCNWLFMILNSVKYYYHIQIRVTVMIKAILLVGVLVGIAGFVGPSVNKKGHLQ